MEVEIKSEEEHNLSQATQGYEANQNLDGLGITNLCEDAGDEIDELEENSGLEMPRGKGSQMWCFLTVKILLSSKQKQ